MMNRGSLQGVGWCVPVHLPPKPSVDLDALLEAREIDQKTYDRVKRLERVVTVTVLNRTTSIFGPLLMDEVRLPDGVMICKHSAISC